MSGLDSLQRDPAVLVTGGAGFIGSNAVRLLLEHGYRVTVLDNFAEGTQQNLEGLRINLVEGDIRDSALMDQVVAEHDGIVHLAAQPGVPASLKDPLRDCDVNVVGTLRLLEAARAHALKRFVFASSSAPLGRQTPPSREDKAPLPLSPYGASKLAGEGYCLGYHGSWGLGTVVLRFSNVYGPFSVRKQSVVTKFFTDLHSKGEITINGDGHQTRDFIYVADLCRAILLALRSNISGEVIQIATGLETSILELAELVQQVVGRGAGITRASARQGDVERSYSSIAKARDVLGWEPEVQLKDGLERTWRWIEPRF